MNKRLLFYVIITLVMCIQNTTTIANKTKCIDYESIIKYNELIKQNDWKLFTKAIMKIESEHNETIVNPISDATGCLQITPIYVREVNNILKRQKSNKIYKLSDRKSKQKSIEMFNIHQLEHNPNRDKLKCLRQHRGKYSKSYNNAIFNEYEKLKKSSNK